MPYAAQRDLRGKHPIDVFPYLVAVDGTGSLYDGTGSQITSLNVTSSQAISASYEIIYETSSSYANFADSSSYTTSASYSSASFSSSYALNSNNSLTSSFIAPSFGVVLNVSNATGSSAGTAGFTDAAELGAFILAVSSSFETLNSLIEKLRAAGVIT